MYSCSTKINKTLPNEPLKVQSDHKNDIVIDLTQKVYFYTDAYFLDEKKSKPDLDSMLVLLNQATFNKIEIDVISKNGAEYDLISASIMSGRIRDYLIQNGIVKDKVFADWSVNPRAKRNFSIFVNVNGL